MNGDDSDQRIVLTGLACLSAAGIGVDKMVASLRNQSRHFGRQCGYPIGEITDFDPKQYVRPRKALKVMCREMQTSFAASILAAGEAALIDEDGGLRSQVDPSRLATIFGSEMLYHPSDLSEATRVAIEAAQEKSLAEPIDVVAFGQDGIKKITPLWLLKYLPNMPACHVGISLGALGPNNTLVTGDVSGVDALAEAIAALRRGIADTAVVASAGSRISETRFVYRCDTPLPSVDSSGIHEDTIAIPGDPESTGVVLGEGAAAVIVETAASANRRGASPIAEVVATSQHFVASKALALTTRHSHLRTEDTRASREAIRLAIASALQRSGFPDIDLVVSHQCGDPVSDAEESDARAAFESLRRAEVFHPIRSIGHSGAASGLIEVVSAAALLQDRPSDQPRHALTVCYTNEGAATATVLRSI